MTRTAARDEGGEMKIVEWRAVIVVVGPAGYVDFLFQNRCGYQQHQKGGQGVHGTCANGGHDRGWTTFNTPETAAKILPL